MARTVASATYRTAGHSHVQDHDLNNGDSHGHGHGNGHCHGQLHGRNNTTNARRLLRRSCLGRAAAGKPPSCGPRYCCADEKGQERAQTLCERDIITEENKKAELTFHDRLR